MVHPRGCGEQVFRHGIHPPRFGSSPRVRGTADDRRQRYCPARFILAGAGNRLTMGPPPRPEMVHPRGCGEQIVEQHNRRKSDGSSPRVRGTAARFYRLSDHEWFIPAGAGNRTRCTHKPHSGPVHPRGCGEQVERRIGAAAGNRTRCTHKPHSGPVSSHGSSPRVRGTAEAAAGIGFIEWFIPAGAGNSQLCVF